MNPSSRLVAGDQKVCDEIINISMFEHLYLYLASQITKWLHLEP